jgi:threonine synthase
VYETGGCALAVDDDALVAGVHELAAAEGAFICPEGGATVAAAQQLRAQGWLDADDEVVLLNTGAGIKYPEVVGLPD